MRRFDDERDIQLGSFWGSRPYRCVKVPTTKTVPEALAREIGQRTPAQRAFLIGEVASAALQGVVVARLPR